MPNANPDSRPLPILSYSPISARPVYDWPDGKRLAIYIGLNLEWLSFGEGLGAELAPGGPQPDVLNYAWRDYGNRVGVFRLAECRSWSTPKCTATPRRQSPHSAMSRSSVLAGQIQNVRAT